MSMFEVDGIRYNGPCVTSQWNRQPIIMFKDAGGDHEVPGCSVCRGEQLPSWNCEQWRNRPFTVDDNLWIRQGLVRSPDAFPLVWQEKDHRQTRPRTP